MKLSEQEIGMGLMIVVCKCCGNVYKAHGLSNALAYNLTPNFGCEKCQGFAPENRKTIKENNMALNHSIPVGALVEIGSGARLFVRKHTRDCDGTPLYILSVSLDETTWHSGGYPFESLRTI